MKGKQLFTEILSSLKKIGAKLSNSILFDQGVSMEQIHEMLKQENREFELKMQNVLNIECHREDDYKLLILNRIQWELYIESVIWGRRLHSLFCSPYVSKFSSENPISERSESVICGSSSGNEGGEFGGNSMKESFCQSITEEVAGSVQNAQIEGSLSKNEVPGGHFNPDIPTEPETNLKREELEDDKSSLPDHLRVKTTIRSMRNLSISDAVTNSSGSQGLTASGSVQPNSQSFDAWIWKSLSEILEMYVSELQRGCSSKYEPSRGQMAKLLPTGLQFISEEGSRLHMPLDNDAYMVSE